METVVNAKEIEIMEKPVRVEKRTLQMYLEDIANGVIRKDLVAQRCEGQWDTARISLLIWVVLTRQLVPQIFIGEVPQCNGTIITYLVDGLQRSTSLFRFRYGNLKLNLDVNVPYQTKDEDGNDVIKLFNLKGATFDSLPNELKAIFDRFSIDLVVFQDQTVESLVNKLDIYNNGKPMTESQKALTKLPRFAGNVRDIINDTHFFEDCGKFSPASQKNGTIEANILQSYMTVFALNDYKKEAKKIADYINENGTDEKFDELKSLFYRLYDACEGKYKTILVPKNTCIFVAAFADYTKYYDVDDDFVKFIDALEDDLHEHEIDGESWDSINLGRNTRDKKTVEDKVNFIIKLMHEYLDIDENSMVVDSVEVSTPEVVEEDNHEEVVNDEMSLKDFVNANTTVEYEDCDIKDFEEDLDEIMERTIKLDSKLRDEANHNAMVAILAYGYEKDVDMEAWLEGYAKRNNFYINDPQKSFNIMADDIYNTTKAA